MFLGKKHWAARFIGEAGVPLDGRVAAELSDMLIVVAEQYQRALHRDPMMKGADELDYLMLAARAAPDSRSALERLVKTFDLTEDRARRLLELVRESASRIFAAEGRALP
jgi:hypothetical protein